MDTDTIEKQRIDASIGSDKAGNNSTVSNVMVCISDDRSSVGAIGHARAVASSFGGKIFLVHVIESPRTGSQPLDPVDWDVRRRKAKSRLAELAREFETLSENIEIKAFEGRPVDQICACASNRPQDIIAVSRNSNPGIRHAWNTGHGVVESNVGSVLMVPGSEFTMTPKSYSRVFVPLDGSSMSESAVPKAVAIAKAHKAEVIICHVTPEAAVAAIGVNDEGPSELRDLTAHGNKQSGQEYLSRVKDMIADCGLSVKTMLIIGGGVRRALMNAVKEQSADILVMASHGRSGIMDVPSGHVASFILDHSEIPVLMVRQPHKPGDAHYFSDVVSKGVRHPVLTN